MQTAYSLDQFSTSPTDLCSSPSSSLPEPSKSCSNNAPRFAYQIEGKQYGIVQGCCNDWNCPRCGQMRAKQEYGRIVEGCRKIAEHDEIKFITITCRGKEITAGHAIAHYLEWTNRFLDACRVKAKRGGQNWYYVQVTEYQKRGFPHSHILTTFDPGDITPGHVAKWQVDRQGIGGWAHIEALRSDWIRKQVLRSGLGKEYDISIVRTIEGTSRYVAKYLFKDTIFTAVWPKGWKRVRYSQSFPKLPERKTDAFVLLSREDWYKLAEKALIVRTTNDEDWFTACYWLHGHDVIVK